MAEEAGAEAVGEAGRAGDFEPPRGCREGELSGEGCDEEDCICCQGCVETAGGYVDNLFGGRDKEERTSG